MFDPESGHLSATIYLRSELCRKRARLHSRLFAFPISYTLSGRKTLRRNFAHLALDVKTSSLIQRQVDDFVPRRAGVEGFEFYCGAPRKEASLSRSAKTPPAVTAGPAPGPLTIIG